MRYFLLVIAVIGICSYGCKEPEAKTKRVDELIPDTDNSAGFQETLENQEGMDSEDAFCRIIRKMDFGQGPEIYLLNICPDEGEDIGYGMNIAAPGEPAVTVLLDTIKSFSSEKAARDYALVHEIFDVQITDEAQ